MRIPVRLACWMFCLVSVPAMAQEVKLSLKAEKAAVPKEISAAIGDLLAEEAYQVRDASGEVYCTIWLRKEIPSKATPEQVKNGLTYREITQTTVIGVIQLPKKWTDYRKQEIPAGVYTLRLAWQPQDGDHMGTAPYNEFVLLCPADKDTKPDTMDAKSLHELSGASIGATHPAVMLLYPNSKPEDEPKLIDKGGGIVVLTSKRAIAAGDQKTTLGFAFVVAGHTKE